MPKRKSNPCVPASVVPSLGSLDAALDILACDTFSRLDAVARKFEAAAGIQLNQGVVATRWKEAVNRYWMTKSMEQCCMAMANGAEVPAHSEVQMGDSADVTDEAAEGSGQSHCKRCIRYSHALVPGRRDSGSRPLPPKPYPGAVAVHELCEDEEREWRHWTPKIGDVVLVELPEDGIWPGKVKIHPVLKLTPRTAHRQAKFLPGSHDTSRQPLLPRANIPRRQACVSRRAAK